MNCRNCKADCAEKGTDHEKKSCLGYVPMTNADRIRSMSDEELSFFLDTATVCVCFPCTRDINNLKHFNNCKHERGSCEKEWLEWLKGEAE